MNEDVSLNSGIYIREWWRSKDSLPIQKFPKEQHGIRAGGTTGLSPAVNRPTAGGGAPGERSVEQ